MARERIIEGTWICSSCGLRDIKARHKSCTGCGNPRESTGSESQFEFGAATASGGVAGESVTDGAVLEIAGAGADWFCAYCEASNRGDHPQCRTCSASRDEARPAAPVPAVSTFVAPRSRFRWSYVLFGCLTPVFALVTAFCGYIFWAIQTNDYPGTVTKVSWSRTARRETFTSVQKRGWRDNLHAAAAVMPRDGRGEFAGVERVRDCRTQQRGTRQVADGTQRVCTTRTRSKACGTEERCHTKDLGNGFVKEVCDDVTRYCDESYEDCRDETRYRSEPVFGEECTYDTWEWHASGEKALTGGDDTPRWPEWETGARDRVVRTETYAVELEYEHRQKRQTTSFQPRTEEEFSRWPPGTKAVLVVANDGRLTGFRDGNTLKPIGNP